MVSPSMTLSTVPDRVVACVLMARVTRTKTDGARANRLAFLNFGEDKIQALNVHAMLHPKPAAILMTAAVKEFKPLYRNHLELESHTCISNKPLKRGPRVYCPIACKIFCPS